MEFAVAGAGLRFFARTAIFLGRVGSDLVFQAYHCKLDLHTLNASRSAYAAVSLSRGFFDSYAVYSLPPSSPGPVQCSVLLKSLLAVLRTPPASVDRLVAALPSPDAPKLRITLHCNNGVKKTYWIPCMVESQVQTLILDRNRFSSRLAIRPRDLSRLLSNFQSSLHEITVIATEPTTGPPEDYGEIGGKAVELRSYIDPANDNNDTRLHTQLWVDPAEEFFEYNHHGDPVDITFGVKELKAFLIFCEGCEVDINLFFEKAGEPILMVPKFAEDDGSNSDFDVTLVLATMLASQLTDESNTQQTAAGRTVQLETARASEKCTDPANASNHTKIWSELSGSAAKIFEDNPENLVQMEGNSGASMQNARMKCNINSACQKPTSPDGGLDTQQLMEVDHNLDVLPDPPLPSNPHSQHHPSNWIGDEDEDDDEVDEEFVRPTPQYD